ncbi:DUF389 domain-containing protein [Thermomonospora cellulosilytica]|uniref:Putative hydrophobic protein (TIGR00271 family) n=1 Tax=Thermomonospora cellulosilytica TaxID=1411118 RepID=A0A7W3R690_9ACTN|nr:DUF389 domain-containing protein [Thermomonospora cellulosilytica]MBA9001261.1 putative hydrophobic protein (TIGR00271 family) [Thermomonospora cellulosilytica]
MLHLRVIAPPGRTDEVCKVLDACLGATNVVVLPDAARRPAGDVVLADVARESANEVIAGLQALDVHRDGSIALDDIDVSISEVADRAEALAPGHGDDAVIWRQLDERTADETRLTWAFVIFLTLATQLAGIAAMIDSPILVVGAMVLGPEFGTVAAMCYGLVFRDPRRVVRALGTMAAGFALAIVITFVCALVSRWIGVIELDRLPESRPLTAFIYSPDRWSFIVALLAGAAGVLSVTAGKSSALVGVFISVTTVPAAGNLAVALALEHWSEITGSVLQLLVNLAGMVLAGVVTLVAQRVGWDIVQKRQTRARARTTGE